MLAPLLATAAPYTGVGYGLAVLHAPGVPPGVQVDVGVAVGVGVGVPQMPKISIEAVGAVGA